MRFKPASILIICGTISFGLLLYALIFAKSKVGIVSGTSISLLLQTIGSYLLAYSLNKRGKVKNDNS